MRYFLHVEELNLCRPDWEGEHFSSLKALRIEVPECARELMAINIRQGVDASGWALIVLDAAGHLVLRFPCREALGRQG